MAQVPVVRLWKDGKPITVNVADAAKWQADGWQPDQPGTQGPPQQAEPQAAEPVPEMPAEAPVRRPQRAHNK